MKNEFEFSDFYFLNDINVNNRMSSDELSALYDSMAQDSIPDDLIEISDSLSPAFVNLFVVSSFITVD